MKKYQKINKKKPPKLFLGGAAGISAIASIIGAGASLFGSISSANAQEKLAEQQMKDRERENLLKKIDQDKDVLRTYPVGGKQLSYYKRGGLISTKPGRTRIKPVPKLEGGGTVPDFNAYRKKYATPKPKNTATPKSKTPTKKTWFERNIYDKSAGSGSVLKDIATTAYNTPVDALTIVNNTLAAPFVQAWDAVKGRSKPYSHYWQPSEEKFKTNRAYPGTPVVEALTNYFGGKVLGGVANKFVNSGVPIVKSFIKGIGKSKVEKVITKAENGVPKIDLRTVSSQSRPALRQVVTEKGYVPRPPGKYFKRSRSTKPDVADEFIRASDAPVVQKPNTSIVEPRTVEVKLKDGTTKKITVDPKDETRIARMTNRLKAEYDLHAGYFRRAKKFKSDPNETRYFSDYDVPQANIPKPSADRGFTINPSNPNRLQLTEGPNYGIVPAFTKNPVSSSESIIKVPNWIKSPSEPTRNFIRIKSQAALPEPKPVKRLTARSSYYSRTPDESAVVIPKLKEMSYKPSAQKGTPGTIGSKPRTSTPLSRAKALVDKQTMLKQESEINNKLINKYIESGDTQYGTISELINHLETNPFIKSSLRKRYELAYGGSSDSSLPKRNTKKLSPVADLITNGKGTTSGTHEQGYDIPVKRNGRTTAYVEPGEVALKTNNGSKYILSKRSGFAQEYMDLESKRQALATLKSRTTGVKGNMVKLQLDNIVKKMQSLPAEQEQLNAGKRPKMRMDGGGFEPTDKNYEDRRKPYDNLFSKLYPNGTEEQYKAFYKDMDNRIREIHASGKYSNSTQTSIPSNTPKIYGVNYDGWVYLNKNLMDPHDQLIVDRFGSGNDSDNWTDNDIKLIDETRARVEAKTRYYHDESLDVIPDKVVKTRKSTTSSTNRTPTTIPTSPTIPAKEIQITPRNYIKDIDLFNKAGIRRGIPSIVDKTQFSNPSVNNRYSMFNRKTPLYSDLTIDPNLTKTPGLKRTSKLEERVIPQKAPIRSNSAFKNAFKTAFNSENIGTTAQGVGALTDIAGMIISNNSLKNLKTPPPVVVPTGGYHTRYDDSAERANLTDVTRMAIKSRKYGDSISSNASIKDLMNASWQQSNQIAGNKFNLETQLRNEAFAKDSRANELNAAARTQYNKDEFERRYQTNVANPQQITSRLAQHLGDFGNKLDVKHRDMTSMVTTAMSADNASFEAMAKAGYFNNLDLNLLKAISPEKYALLMKHKR